MKVATYHLKATFITELLGSQPNRDVAMEFIAAKSGIELPDDEIQALPEEVMKATTVFHRNPDGAPILFDYQIKGAIKEAGQFLNGKEGVKNLRNKIENALFIAPRTALLHLPMGSEITYCQRPLRAQTAQGPRIALARSEMAPIGTWFECNIQLLPGELTRALLVVLLDYLGYKGLGQWRGGGYGRIEYTLDGGEE